MASCSPVKISEVLQPSYFRVESDGVVVRKWPGAPRHVARADIDRFDVLQRKASLFSRGGPFFYLAMLLKDGTSLEVPCLDNDLHRAALNLNNEVGGV